LRYCDFFCVVSLEEDEDPAELLGLALLGEDAPPLEDWSLEELGLELEDEDDGELGVVLAEPDIELEDEGVLLVPAEEAPEGEDGEVLEDEPVAERLVSEREAPVVEPGPLSQPYNAPAASTTGRTAMAVFFSNFMW
jgi:hypothetical protein